MNDLLQMWPVLVAFLVLGLSFGFAFNQRRLGRLLVAQAEKHVADFQRQEEQHVEDLQGVVELKHQCETAERRAREYQGFIVGVQGERDTWRELYFGQASGADAAQGMMMREIERLERAYHQATGKRAPRDPVIAEVRKVFTEQNGTAVDEFRKDGGAARAAAQAVEETKQLEAIAAGGEPKED